MSNHLANFIRSIPLPRGPQWYLIAYRWLLVAAGLFTVAVTWNVWQVRSGPEFEYAPMLPTWDWLPQFDFGPWIVGALLLVLVLPRTGMTVLSVLLVLSVVWDQMRLHPHYQIVLLLWGTLPGINARFFGRASLVAIWFWVGFHKLLIDFIKPEEMSGFISDIIPNDLARHFPREQFPWNTPELGNAVGWIIGITETLLAVFCLVPRTRWLVGIVAVGLHMGIIWWNCWSPWCNLLGFNIALMFAGLALIVPWRDWPWVSWRQCNWPIRVSSILLLVYPAAYYLNWMPAYLSYCIYVPNTPFAMLHRPGEEPKFVPLLPTSEISFPLPPGHEFSERWFEKIRKPGDVLIIHDPRPWAQANGMNGRQLTDFGNFPRGDHWVNYYKEEGGEKNSEGDIVDGKKRGLWRSWHPNGKLAEQGVMIDDLEQGLWVRRYPNGNKESEGRYKDGVMQGRWTTWYPDGRKETEGNYVNGQMQGMWTTWTKEGQEVRWDASITP